MRISLNLWLWRYKEKRRVSEGFHLMADEAACHTLMSYLADPDFDRRSIELRQVPVSMPAILGTKDPRYVAFERLRLYAARDQVEPFRAEENDGLDVYLNDQGFADVHQGLTWMLKGDWDYTYGGVSYWGLLSDEDYRKRYGAQ